MTLEESARKGSPTGAPKSPAGAATEATPASAPSGSPPLDYGPDASDDFGFTREGRVYRQATGGHAEREIGIVRTTAPEALAYFRRRFEQLEGKVKALLEQMDTAENRGSYLKKILHLIETLPHENALGDFGPMIQTLRERELELRASIAGNRVKNLEIKESLLGQMRALRDENIDDYRQVAPRLREIRLGWIKTGPVAADQQEAIEGEFALLNRHFQAQRATYVEERQMMIAQRLARLDAILERQRELMLPDAHPGQIVKTLQQLTQEWRQAGNVPKDEYEPRREQFKATKKELMRTAKRKFKAKAAGGPPSPGAPAGAGAPRPAAPRPLTPEEIERNQNFEQKRTLYREALAILDKGDFRGAYQKVKELQAVWHKIGQIPRPKQDINKDFVYVCDRISEFSYLQRMLYQQNPYYYKLPPKDLTNLRVAIMRDIIRKEEADLETLGAQLRARDADPAAADDLETKQLRGRVNAQQRRLGVKKEILDEEKTRLNELMG